MLRLIFHKLLFNTQVLYIQKAFADGSSANIKVSETHQSKILQLGGFFSLKSILNPGQGKLIMYKIKETAIENEDILASPVETGLQIRRSKNFLLLL